MKNKPSYSITSVDHALHLASLLQQEGPVRVTDAAKRLGVSDSTAHRLLAMLVYRDFAEQMPDRRYRAGKVLRPVEMSEAPVVLLRRVALPHLQRLVGETQESANVMVLAGTEVRFIATVECHQILRVGDRVGRSLPAHMASGGKPILAALPPDQLTALYDGADGIELPRLKRELALVRKRGFAINDQRTETGLTAVGMLIRNPVGEPEAGLSLAMPTARFDRDMLPTLVGAMSATTARIESDLAAGWSPSSASPAMNGSPNCPSGSGTDDANRSPAR
ncbi:IclR family transcriptional regulator [Streptomyces sp. NBC_00257]|uniref:IclR family transcriptional regulator n=1 Tax=unclassified Streptomyces TaxID=2593676 RepID=UPI002253D5E3|nr:MULTISPECIES: IclR family transcriptional regulator [unclassified Streptomyces]MCX4398706.1 IclR family transcriptional regulator [Streptomyces sp. NBC_01767]MCX4870972.1 IclR family transcriptional regulator [Streptomyces sp. NBC_00906]MCX4901711.1 IclR family transcriptional regulator [Streptomyces sp. NBC_00892]MCX5426953.1 IclR family transcriptional regulator [Streptomyces sp. NBC_00062]WSP51002.1 IclR family transcriptional regulator [Streptomyces sp. NBC_01243]